MILVLVACTANSAEDSSRAVMESSKEMGIVLSEAAKKNIGFKTFKITGTSVFRIPLEALVYTKDMNGVYSVDGKWTKFIPVKVVSKESSTAEIIFSGQVPNEIVSSGTALVRVSEMEAFSSEE